MQEWGVSKATAGKVTLMADADCALTKAMGLDCDLSAVLGGGPRSKRYALELKKGKVTKVKVDDIVHPSCSLVNGMVDGMALASR